MGHNSVVSGHPKSTRIPRVDGLSTGPSDLGRHKPNLDKKRFMVFPYIIPTHIVSNIKEMFQTNQYQFPNLVNPHMSKLSTIV